MSQTSQRCCSFCRELGHRVPNCNDQRLIDFEILCNTKKVLCEIETTILDDAKNRFRNWLYDKMLYQPQTIKAFSYSRCGATRRTDPSDILNKIVEYVFRVDEPTNDDFIPFNNNDSNRFLTNDLSLAFSLLNISVTQIGQQNNEQIGSSLQTINTIIEQIDECELDAHFECNICCDETLTIKKSCKLNCKHKICVICVSSIIKTSQSQNKLASCAYCREVINEITASESSILDQIFETTV